MTKTPTGEDEETGSKASFKVVEPRRKAGTYPIKQVQTRTSKPSSVQKSTPRDAKTIRTRTTKTKEL